MSFASLRREAEKTQAGSGVRLKEGAATLMETGATAWQSLETAAAD